MFWTSPTAPLMLERVTEYLMTAIEDPTRRLGVRRFAFTWCAKLSRERACVGWRPGSIKPVSRVGMGRRASDHARYRANWKVDQVRGPRQLLDAMMPKLS